ncbi:hypothetical protein B296_00043528 [Ensete ventricosum]|uniref:Uncharacterized protein n=1 Tax=Ensete ventricosum TaxID=4639 RepID=A0A426ZE48_ENSVE|nr:hypothetical protein B296_00043528 [Ensete ventricosum]
MLRWCVEMIALSLLKVDPPMITLYAKRSSTTIKGTMKVLGSSSKVMGSVTTPTGVIASPVNPVKVEVMGMRFRLGVVVVWVLTLGFEGDLRAALYSGFLLNFCMGISFPCRGAVTTRDRAAYYNVYLSLHGAFWAKGQLAWLSYIPVEVATTYEVFNLVLQIVALLGVVSVVTMEAAVASAVLFLVSSPHRVGGFEESFLLDLEEDLNSGGGDEEVGLKLFSELIERVDRGERQPTVPPSSIPRRVVRKSPHVMPFDVPYRAICARNVATCSIGSEPPSYASSVGTRKCSGWVYLGFLG